MPWPRKTSTCRSFVTISSGLCRLFAIVVLLHGQNHTSRWTRSMGVDHRIDAGLSRELVDNWRLELNLCQQEWVRLPVEAVEDHKPRRVEFAVCIRHPSGFIKSPNKGRGEFCLIAAVVGPPVSTLEDSPATPFLEVGEALPEQTRSLDALLGR